MRTNWASVGGILLAAVAVLTTLFAGLVVMGCVPIRSRDADRPPPSLEEASDLPAAEAGRARS